MRSVWQQNLNSAGVQNSVIICLFIITLGLITIWFSFALNAHVFRFIFLIVTFLFLLKDRVCLNSAFFHCMFVC